MRHWLVMFLVLSCIAMSANPIVRPAYAEEGEKVESTRIRYVDKNAKRRVTVLRHRAERTDTGLLKVKILLRNEYKQDGWINIKCVFLDEDGFEVEATNDEAVELPSKRDTPYIITSLGTQVHDYTIYLDKWSRSTKNSH